MSKLFGGSSSANDEIIKFQKQQAEAAAAKAAELERRRTEARGNVNAIFDGGKARTQIKPEREVWFRQDPTPGANPKPAVNDPWGLGQVYANQSATPGKKPAPVKVDGPPPAISSGLAALFGNQIPGVNPGSTYYSKTRPAQYETKKYKGIGEDFYTGYRDSILGWYEPELARQYQNAADENTYALARQGLSRSSAASQRQSDLARDFQVQSGLVTQDADAQTAQLRERVNREKQAALELAASAEDPTMAIDRALTEVNAAQNVKPNLSPLGDIFNAAAQGWQSWQLANAGREYLKQVPQSSPYKSSGRSVT